MGRGSSKIGSGGAILQKNMPNNSTAVLSALNSGDNSEAQRILDDANIGTNITYTEETGAPGIDSDIREITYTKMAPDVWSGRDNTGGRIYTDQSTKDVVQMVEHQVRGYNSKWRYYVDPNVKVVLR